MEESEENNIEKKYDKISVKIINNEIENLGEITANMEFNVIVVGKEGKYYICNNYKFRCWKNNFI